MRNSVLILAVVALAACSSAAPSTVPSVAPTSNHSPEPSAAPSVTSAPTSIPTPTATFAACPVPTWHEALPSGRLVEVTVASAASVDTVTFRFEPGGDNPGTPTGELTEVRPPFSEAASGLPITVEGDHFLQVRFDAMTIVDASGNPVYRGEHDLRPGYPALREVVNYDEFEGVVGWIVGLTGPTCVRVMRVAIVPAGGDALTIEIAHP